MADVYQIRQVEASIMRVDWDGVLNRDTFRAATEARVRFADEHFKGQYVLIFDLRKARITILDVRLTAWSANVDPRMTHTIVIGRAGVSMVVANTLVRLSKLQIEFVNSDGQALQRARQIVQGYPKASGM